MAPRPTGRYGLLRIPAPGAARVEIRFALLANRDKFNPAGWPLHGLTASAGLPGWWEFDLDAQGLADGSYEYEFVLDGDTNSPAADPYADELTRFGGYRGVFRMLGGVRVKQGFRWDDEVVAGLPGNNQIVIYEMPLKWMTSATDNPLVDLGTFDQTIYEHLDDLRSLGVNCIELLPIADTPQTLDWGYGTRFFFAPDLDMGVSVDAKFFVKACHARGIRVLLDVVMDFYSNRCPLNQLARPWFEEPTPGTRNGWGAILFRFDTPEPPGYFAAREFLCEMAEFWVMEYHIDGYRIDDFADVGNWAFVQEFRNRATAASAAAFPGKPFLVVAEDSNRRFVLTDGSAYQGAKVVDGIWNFGFQDEIRKLVTNSLSTDAGKPGRTERVKHFLGVGGTWNGYSGSFDPGYGDMTCAVNYATSHDVANAPRMMNLILEPMLGGLGLTKVDAVRSAVDMSLFGQPAGVVTAALDRVFGVFALIMTSVGIPMFLAGEEFGDVHDVDYDADHPKQQDPVQWTRAGYAANAALRTRVGGLIQLRTTQAALQRNEIAFFHFHPDFDTNDGARVFGYCRTGGLELGSAGQVIVLANMGAQSFANYGFAGWAWAGRALREVGGLGVSATLDPATGAFVVALQAFDVRVFAS